MFYYYYYYLQLGSYDVIILQIMSAIIDESVIELLVITSVPCQ